MHSLMQSHTVILKRKHSVWTYLWINNTSLYGKVSFPHFFLCLLGVFCLTGNTNLFLQQVTYTNCSLTPFFQPQEVYFIMRVT